MKIYLGDGVYVDLNRDGQFVLTTENGVRTTNTIYLEPEVWTALLVYAERAIEDRLARITASKSQGR